MQFLLLLVLVLSLIFIAHSAILKSPMVNNYPQIAVLGCDSNKANLYYDVQRQVWVEHLVSSCVNNEQSILKFCQQVYPSLHIGNIVQLDTDLRFEKWCELASPDSDNNIPRCKTETQTEDSIQPFRCLHENSNREEVYIPTIDCTRTSLTNTGECLRAEKWQQQASLDCDKKSMLLNSSIMTLEWCGLSQFRGVEFICCPLQDLETKKNNENDYETSLNEQEDDPIHELIVLPKTSTIESHRRIIAMSLASNEPNWMENYRQWTNDPRYFANDEDVNDDKDEIKLSSARKSHLTINEHERFTKEKEGFKQTFKEQIEKLKSRWQKRQYEIQQVANRDANQAQQEYEKSESEFQQEYNSLKQTASLERTRINQLHENNLDKILDSARNETNQKLISAWNEKPLKTQNIQDALYNYLHVLLRDRIHLVNRYERLRVVDPDQAIDKRVSIHVRLRLISTRINDALNQLQRYANLQSKIRPQIDILLGEYDEVNQAAEKLLIQYIGSLTPNRLSPLGRDEKQIYPFSSVSSNKVESEYAYDTSDEYEDDDDDDDEKTTTIKSNNGDSDWDVDTDGIININLKSNTNEQKSPSRTHIRPITSNFFVTYLLYIIGIILLLSLIIGLLIFRFIIQRRRKTRHGGKYEKNYAFKEIESCTPEEKALHALQMSGYENPTYKFFEGQTAKC